MKKIIFCIFYIINFLYKSEKDEFWKKDLKKKEKQVSLALEGSKKEMEYLEGIEKELDDKVK